MITPPIAALQAMRAIQDGRSAICGYRIVADGETSEKLCTSRGCLPLLSISRPYPCVSYLNKLTSLAASLFRPGAIVRTTLVLQSFYARCGLGSCRTRNLAAITLHNSMLRYMYDRCFHVDHTASLQRLVYATFSQLSVLSLFSGSE
jgi:hypothetical protein